MENAEFRCIKDKISNFMQRLTACGGDFKECADDEIIKQFKTDYGIYPVNCAFWDAPLVGKDGAEIYSMVPADMLHDFDLGTIKDALLRLLNVLQHSEPPRKKGRIRKIRKRIKLVSKRCNSIPNIKFFEYDDAGKEHRKDMRRFPHGFWKAKDKAWAGSDYRAMLAQAFIAIGDDDKVLDRRKYKIVRLAFKQIIEVTLELRKGAAISDKELDHLMKKISLMSQSIKKAFIDYRPSKYKHPKFHTKVHYAQWVRLFGFYGNYTTESFEAWFKAGVKDASQLGNQKTDGWEQIWTRLQIKDISGSWIDSKNALSTKERIEGYHGEVTCPTSCSCSFCISGDCESCNNLVNDTFCASLVEDVNVFHSQCILKELPRTSRKISFEGHLNNAFTSSLKYFRRQEFRFPEFKNLITGQISRIIGHDIDSVNYAVQSVALSAELRRFNRNAIFHRSFIRVGKLGCEWVEMVFKPLDKNDDDQWFARVLLFFSCVSSRHGKEHDLCLLHNMHIPRQSRVGKNFPHFKYQMGGVKGFDVVNVRSILRPVYMIPNDDNTKDDSFKQFFLFESPMF